MKLYPIEIGFEGDTVKVRIKKGQYEGTGVFHTEEHEFNYDKSVSWNMTILALAQKVVEIYGSTQTVIEDENK